MTDCEKLLVAMWCDEDADAEGELSVLDVMAMLFAVGQQRRRAAFGRSNAGGRSHPSRSTRSAA